ncbi:hypothetical protein C8F01DRAFT_273300 [Mycena amicta]|nr:hypothetical protein C8F01DRAFT_273300 [Mycena amicta]
MSPSNPHPPSEASSSRWSSSNPETASVPQGATWFHVVFKASKYTTSEVKDCLAVEIEDLITDMSHLLSPRTRAELHNAKSNDLAKVDILFRVLNSRHRDIELLSSFYRALSRLVGIKHMLGLALDDSNYEEILASKLAGASLSASAGMCPSLDSLGTQVFCS